jgi:uncharacterized membrane protein
MVTVTLTTGVLVGCSVVVSLLLARDRPTVDRGTTLSVLPWLVVATILDAIHSVVEYPSAVEPAFSTPWSFLAMGTLWGIVWLLLARLTRGSRSERVTQYLGAIGVGIGIVPFAVLMTTRGSGIPTGQLLAWAITPALACLVTYAVLISLWLILPRTASFAGFAGALLLFGLGLHAVIAGFAVGFGAWSPSPLIVDLSASLAAMLDVSERLALVWLTILEWLLLAIGVVVGFGVLARSRTALARRGFDAATVLGVLAGSNTFVLALAQGVVA